MRGLDAIALKGVQGFRQPHMQLERRALGTRTRRIGCAPATYASNLR